MNKTLLATSMAMALGVCGTADAAFSGGDGDYTMTITSGCFAFGDCAVGGLGDYTDNTTQNQADASAFSNPAGSGIINDGIMGVIEFTLTGGNISVTSYSQDSYLGTAGGTFWIRSTNLGTMGGTINAAGDVSFDPTGRVGLAATTGLPELIWNLDDSTAVNGTSSGTTSLFTTGTSTALLKAGAFGNPISKTGSVLVDNGAGGWDGQLVSASNVGDAWGASFSGIAYTEVFDVTVTADAPVIPIPAAVWLFGSGLLGLVGVARRRKQA